MARLKKPESKDEMLAELLEEFRSRYTPDNQSTLWMEHYITRLESVIHEHVKKPVGPNNSPLKHPARGAGETLQVPPIPRHTPKPRSAAAPGSSVRDSSIGTGVLAVLRTPAAEHGDATGEAPAEDNSSAEHGTPA